MPSIRTLSVMVALLATPLSAQAASSEALTREQIAQQIIGKTLNAKRLGMSVRIFYKSDGTVTMKFPLMSGAGTWVYHGDGVCMTLTSGPKRGKTCVTFEYLGGTRYRNSEGIEFDVAR